MALTSKTLVSNGSKGHHKFTLTVNENSTDISSNTSSLSFALVLSPIQASWDWYGWNQSIVYSININGKVYSGYIPNYDGASAVTLNSGSLSVEHNSDGAKSINVSFSVTDTTGQSYTSGNASASGTMALTTIPRQANITSASDFNDEQNPTIIYENKAGNSVSSLQACISLTGANDDIKYREIPKTGTSYTFKLTEEERNILRNATTTSNTRSVIFFIKTVIGNKTLHSMLSKTLSIVNATPTIGSFTYKDTNSKTTAITNNNQRIIRNNSDLLFTIGTATALKGASISSYEVSFAGISQGITSPGNINFGKINLSNNANAKLKITDSRGNSAEKEITVIIDDWVLPTALISLNRKNNFYSETYLKVDASYSRLNGKNDITIRCQYRVEYNSEYSEFPQLQNNVQETYDFDNNYKWYLRILITDKIGTTTYNLTLDRGMPIIFFDRVKNSVGVNTFPEHNKSFEAVGDFYLNGSIPINIGNIILTKEDNWNNLYSPKNISAYLVNGEMGTGSPEGAYSWGQLIVINFSQYAEGFYGATQIYVPDNPGDNGVYIRSGNSANRNWLKVAGTPVASKS